MEVNSAPRTMTAKKPRERKKEVNRKMRHWMWVIREGGPYKGRGGNKGLVWDGGIDLLRLASVDLLCGEVPFCCWERAMAFSSLGDWIVWWWVGSSCVSSSSRKTLSL